MRWKNNAKAPVVSSSTAFRSYELSRNSFPICTTDILVRRTKVLPGHFLSQLLSGTGRSHRDRFVALTRIKGQFDRLQSHRKSARLVRR